MSRLQLIDFSDPKQVINWQYDIKECPAKCRKELIGLEVKRGRTWKWGDQDETTEGRKTIGVIMSADCKHGWYEVKWDPNRANVYRIGNGYCDVVGVKSIKTAIKYVGKAIKAKILTSNKTLKKTVAEQILKLTTSLRNGPVREK